MMFDIAITDMTPDLPAFERARVGKTATSKRRSRHPTGQTRALLETVQARKRTEQVLLYLSAEAHNELNRRAERLGVFPSGLAAYLIEITMRRRGGDSRKHRDNTLEALKPWVAAGISRSWWYARRKAIGATE
jgi:hypothetical protein